MELYPSEQKLIERICNAEATRLKHERTFKFTALSDFSKRLMTRLHEAGFIAVVSTDPTDPNNYELLSNDELVFVPKVDILSRVDGEQAIDFDKMQFEVKKDAGYEISHDGSKKSFD